MYLLITIALFCCYALFGVILMYHWFKFAYNQWVALVAALTYATLGVIIFTLMSAAALSL